MLSIFLSRGLNNYSLITIILEITVYVILVKHWNIAQYIHLLISKFILRIFTRHLHISLFGVIKLKLKVLVILAKHCSRTM